MTNVSNEQIFTDHDLMLKAAGVIFSILISTDVIVKEFQNKIEEVQNLKQDGVDKVRLTVSYVCLFQAQKFFWENVIQKESDASIFEKHLYGLFQKTIGIDPKPHIKELVDYVKSGEPSREIQYVGSRLCRVLGKKDPFLMLNISTIFADLLQHGFFDSLKNAWELPTTDLEIMLGNINAD